MVMVGLTSGGVYDAPPSVFLLQVQLFCSLLMETLLLAMVGELYGTLPRKGLSTNPVLLKFSITLRKEFPRNVDGVAQTTFGYSGFSALGSSYLGASWSECVLSQIFNLISMLGSPDAADIELSLGF